MTAEETRIVRPGTVRGPRPRPRRAAVTTGKYSGLQPAITALAASACTVGTICRGGTGEKGRLSPRTVSTNFATFCSVGM